MHHSGTFTYAVIDRYFANNMEDIMQNELSPRYPTDTPVPETPQNNPRPIGSLTETGFLIIQVFAARRAYPLPGATVQISYPEQNGVISVYRVLLTDISGNTEKLSLPAPPKSLSETYMPLEMPYAVYEIRVTLPGYYPILIKAVPIFSTITSIQPINMIPLTDSSLYNVSENGEIVLVNPGVANREGGPDNA